MGLLQDLFYAGGVLPDSQDNRNLYKALPGGKVSSLALASYDYRPNYFIEEHFEVQAKAMCAFITERKPTFDTIDLIIQQITQKNTMQVWYLPTPKEKYKDAIVNGHRLYEADIEQFCGYIAAFCAENKIYWDDSKFPKYAASNSYIGSALLHYGCMLSQKGQGF